jgi:class 3 adenylate cyclase
LRSSGIKTFLIADIRGYTTYTHEHGDEAAAALAAQFAASVDEVVTAFDGALLELRGDEALVVFLSARQAIRAAVALQEAFATDPADPARAVPVGIGIDAGEAVEVRGGFRGGALNMAARLCGLAAAGQVLATPEVVHLATRIGGVRFRSHGPVHLKGLDQPVEVIAIDAGESEAAVSGRSWRRVRAKSRDGPIAGRTRGRRRWILATAAVIPVVLTALVWGPWLPPAERSSSTGGHKLEDELPLRATLLVNDEFPWPSNVLGHLFMFPNGVLRPEDYPSAAARGTRGSMYWEANHGGVPVVAQTVRLVLDGATREPVLITGVNPFVISKEPPLAGWFILPEVGGVASVRYLETNLACADPPVIVVGGNHAARRDPVSSLDLEVSSLDKEQLEISAYTSRGYLRWGISVTYVSDGEVQTLEVTDPRLRVNAVNTSMRSFVAKPGTNRLERAARFDPTPADVADWAKRMPKCGESPT